MTRNAERLQIRCVVATPVDQRNHVVEFPERPAGIEASLPQPRTHASALDLPAQLVGVELAGCTDPAIAPSDAAAQLARISRQVELDAGRVPASTAVD
jgi:hypothetical protein